MASTCPQRKMPAFSSNIIGNKLHRFSSEFNEIPWKLYVLSKMI